MDTIGPLFLRASVSYLRDTYLPRIVRAVEGLPDEDLWWSPHERTNSVGHLLLHLAGNVQQWIVSGLGGAPDHRERALEFAPEEHPPSDVLLANLTRVVEDACAVIAAVPPAELADRREVQRTETTVLEAIYHVIEHFSWHTGQITSIAKQRAGRHHDIRFYDDSALDAARNA